MIKQRANITKILANYNVKYHNARDQVEKDLIFGFKTVLEEIQTNLPTLDDYWKSTSAKRNVAINTVIFMLRDEGLSNETSHKLAAKIEDLFLELFKSEVSI